MREQGSEGNDLIERLAGDPRLGLDRQVLAEARGSPLGFVGNAVPQAARFVAAVTELVARHPDASSYVGEEIL